MGSFFCRPSLLKTFKFYRAYEIWGFLTSVAEFNTATYVSVAIAIGVSLVVIILAAFPNYVANAKLIVGPFLASTAMSCRLHRQSLFSGYPHSFCSNI